MKIAVLMSTYNGEKYIREQIDSILSQSGDFEIELIVRDDGSTDKTKEYLDLYKKQNALKWYEGDNLGPAKSFMDILRKSKGYDYYAFADQDDLWMPQKIQAGVCALSNSTGASLYFSNADLVDAKLHSLNAVVYKRKPAIDFETLSCAGGVLGCTVIFSRELAEVIQNAEPPLNIIMHDHYLAEVCLSIGGKIIYDPNSCILYRQHGNNAVGVSYGVINKIKNRKKIITTKATIGIAEQAEDILCKYRNKLTPESQKWLKQLALYKRNIISRTRLALSSKTKYGHLNSSLTNRLTIFLGNR